jgi:hypothetical protein
LFGEELHVSLTRVALHERRVDVDALFRILQRLVERKSFQRRSRSTPRPSRATRTITRRTPIARPRTRNSRRSTRR